MNKYTNIKLANIIKIRNHRYFDDKRLNRLITFKIKKLLFISMIHNSVEVLLLVDKDNFNDYISTDNDYNNVSISNEMHNHINSGKHFIAIHNHPNNSNFSIKDLRTFIRIQNLRELFVVTNNCISIAAISKAYNMDDLNTQYKIMKYINKCIIVNRLNDHDISINIIKQLVDKGLLYLEYKNY